MVLLIIRSYRSFRFGEKITWDSVSEDGLNYYLNGWNDSYYGGAITSNYLTLPKYAAIQEKQ